MEKIFNIHDALFRTRSCIRFYKRRGMENGRKSTVYFLTSLALFASSIVLGLASSERGYSIKEGYDLHGILLFLCSPWEGLLDWLFFISCGLPVLVWGIISLVAIVLGIDINKSK